MSFLWPANCSKEKGVPKPSNEGKTNGSGHKVKGVVEKEQKRDYWQQFFQQCWEEENCPQQTPAQNWWENFDKRHKEDDYGSRVQIIEQVSCKLFRTEFFFEVVKFLVLYKGKELIAQLKTLIRMEDEKSRQIIISPAQMVKLKCFAGGSWTVNYKYGAALQRITGKAIQFPSLSCVCIDYGEFL